MIEAQHIARQQGKIRFAGMSTHALAEMLEWTVEKKAFDVVLTVYNFAMDPAMEKAIAAVAETGTGVVAMKVMAGGSAALVPPTRSTRACSAKARCSRRSSGFSASPTSVPPSPA